MTYAHEDTDLLHILVIDDDPEMCRLITNILMPDGHVVISVGSAEEGLEQLPYFAFQIAFLDHNLPGMEGFVLGSYLRDHNPEMTIALVSGALDTRLERLGEERGLIMIPKPFQVEQILDVVTTWRTQDDARRAAATATSAEDWAPRFAPVANTLTETFAIPSVPRRIEEILTHRIRDALNHLRRNYDEHHRSTALCGLLTVLCLDAKLPKLSSGSTLFEEYDTLMLLHGKRTEFGTSPSNP